MKYSDFIDIKGDFNPVCELTDETNIDSWKGFIPANQFYRLLDKVLKIVDRSNSNSNTSIWVQGTYGTGKTYASKVIRHLFCDAMSRIESYIDDKIKEDQLKHSLKSFRKNKKFLPVVLRSTEGVSDAKDFVLTLKEEIKRSVPDGHEISIRSDFEDYVSFLTKRSDDFVQTEIINKSTVLSAMCEDKKTLLNRLHLYGGDISVYKALEKVFKDEGYGPYHSTSDISEWLFQVEKEIKEKKIADGLLIIWDEFTDFLDKADVMAVVQNIAESSRHEDVYLYIITHINPQNRKDEHAKTQGRFEVISYEAEKKSTYQVLSSLLVEKSDVPNIDLYKSIRDEKMKELEELIEQVLSSDQETKDAIKSLFPMHPYTAYLGCSLSDHIGSTNRTVFEFINKGFREFLQDEDAFRERRLLTVDSLFDFFMISFKESIQFGNIIRIYEKYKDDDSIIKKDPKGERVFKGLLLLNAMANIYISQDSNSSLLSPNFTNMEFMFKGEIGRDRLRRLLENFASKGIFRKDDDNDEYLIFNFSLPPMEVTEEKEKLKKNYKSAFNIVKYYFDLKNESIEDFLRKTIFSDLRRVYENCYFSGSDEEKTIENNLNQCFKKPYSLKIALFFAMNGKERSDISDTVQKKSAAYNDRLFVIFKESFNENTSKPFQNFIQFLAELNVAKYHNQDTVFTSFLENKVKKILSEWIDDRLIKGSCHLYPTSLPTFSLPIKDLAKHINEKIAPKIFSHGFDTVSVSEQKNIPMDFYKEKTSETILETLLEKNNKKDVKNEAFNKSIFKHLPLFFDEVIGDDLQLIKKQDQNDHPLIFIQREVDKLLEAVKKKKSHLI